MSATGVDIFHADAGMEDSVPAGERVGAGDGAGGGAADTTPPTGHTVSSHRPPRPPATSASSDRVEPQPIVVDPETDEPDDNADEPHFRCRLEMSKNGNTSLHKHLRVYHSEEFKRTWKMLAQLLMKRKAAARSDAIMLIKQYKDDVLLEALLTLHRTMEEANRRRAGRWRCWNC
eukprot:jgi/Tetstr1/420650/TSEL_011738.t1